MHINLLKSATLTQFELFETLLNFIVYFILNGYIKGELRLALNASFILLGRSLFINDLC